MKLPTNKYNSFNEMKDAIRLHLGIQGDITVSDNYAYYDGSTNKWRKQPMRVYFKNDFTLGRMEYLEADEWKTIR